MSCRLHEYLHNLFTSCSIPNACLNKLGRRGCEKIVANGDFTNVCFISLKNFAGRYHLGDKDVDEFMVLISVFRNCDMRVAQMRFQWRGVWK